MGENTVPDKNDTQHSNDARTEGDAGAQVNAAEVVNKCRVSLTRSVSTRVIITAHIQSIALFSVFLFFCISRVKFSRRGCSGVVVRVSNRVRFYHSLFN